jgi:hypothetical protein
MALNVKANRSVVIDGKTYASEAEVATEVAVKFDKSLAAAKTGTLSARTDNDTGTLTMSAGHGITTGARLDVYWDGGCRAGMTVGTVATNSVPIDGGSGDNLPTATTAITAMVPAEENFVVAGDDVAAIGVQTLASPGVQAQVVFADGADAELYKAVVEKDADYSWTSGDGSTNPLAGDDVAKVFVSHGDSTGAKTVRGVAAYN